MCGFGYLCHEECAGVDHIQKVSEPTKKCVLMEDGNIILNATSDKNICLVEKLTQLNINTSKTGL